MAQKSWAPRCSCSRHTEFESVKGMASGSTTAGVQWGGFAGVPSTPYLSRGCRTWLGPGLQTCNAFCSWAFQLCIASEDYLCLSLSFSIMCFAMAVLFQATAILSLATPTISIGFYFLFSLYSQVHRPPVRYFVFSLGLWNEDCKHFILRFPFSPL